jgi:hypothetical protein
MRVVGTRTAGTNAVLIKAVERAFHTTNHSDQMIADNITAQGISTTRNQVEETVDVVPALMVCGDPIQEHRFASAKHVLEPLCHH